MAEIWYYTSEGKQMDPVPLGELRALAKEGTLKPTDMVWKDGMPRWVRASSATELFPDPSSSLDHLFNVPSASDKNTASAAPAPSNANTPSKEEETVPLQDGHQPRAKKPFDDDEDDRPRRKKRRSDEDDDDEDDRRRRRRPKPAPASNTGLVVGLVVGGGVLLLAIIIGVIVMVASRANPRRPFNQQPVNIKAARIDVPNVNPNPNQAFGPPVLGNETTHVFNVQTGGADRKPITLKPGVRYFISATSEQRGPDVDVYIDQGNVNVAKDDSFGPDSNFEYTPVGGDHHLRVVNLGPGFTTTKVVVAEVVANQPKPETKKPEEKEEPLPAGVLGGSGAVPFKSINAGEDGTFKLQVRAGRTSKISVTTHKPLPDAADVNLVVTRDSDNQRVAADETAGPNASVQVTSAKTETYTVRVLNKSGGPVRCTVSFN